jgi:hypothetical protein
MVVASLLCVCSPVLAQDFSRKDTKTITTCQFELTPQGRTANFRFGFRYLLQAEPDGTLSKTQEISNSQRDMKTKFVKDDLFKDCISQWRLQPAGRYYVSFYVGTTSIGVREGFPLNYGTILGPDKLTFIFELAGKSADLVEVVK